MKYFYITFEDETTDILGKSKGTPEARDYQNLKAIKSYTEIPESLWQKPVTLSSEEYEEEIQVLIPDSEGRLPDDREYEETWGTEIVTRSRPIVVLDEAKDQEERTRRQQEQAERGAREQERNQAMTLAKQIYTATTLPEALEALRGLAKIVGIEDPRSEGDGRGRP